MKGVRHRIFSAKTPPQKRKLRKEDQELREHMKGLLIADGLENVTAKQLASWDPYDQNASSSFFDSEWMFGMKDGFDVVIGNPPYISHDAISNKKYIKNNYKTYEAFADILCYFFEAAIFLLNPKGTVLFITSNSYLRSDYAKPTRNFILEKGSLQKIINMPESQIFATAIVDTAITDISLSNCKNSVQVVDSSIDSMSFNSFVNKNSYNIPQKNFRKKVWGLLPDNISKIQESMEKHLSLEQLGTKIRLGIATGNNDAFLIDGKQKQNFLDKNFKNSKIIKPVLRGKDISRYSYKQPNLFLLLTKNGIDVKKDFSDIYNYLDKFGEKFKNRGAKGRHWTNLRACAFFDDFKKDKIVWIELTNTGKFTLCDSEIYLLNSAYFLIPPEGIKIKYLLSLLNSKAIGFYIRTIATTSGMGTMRWINNYVKEFPIPNISEAAQDILSTMVDILLWSKKYKNNNKAIFFDSIIDGIIFQLYFSDHMTKKQIDILQFVKDDLEKIFKNQNFERLPDNGKEVIVGKLHTRWTHPDSEVRNRIKLFAVRSPEILKPILESR